MWPLTGLAVAPRRTGRPGPADHAVERLSVQRAFTLNRRHQRFAIADVLAHRRVALVARCRSAPLFLDLITIAARTQRYMIVKLERPSHIGAGRAFILEHRID